MSHFEKFVKYNEIVKQMQQYGENVAPFQVIGPFLNSAGKIMLQDI